MSIESFLAQTAVGSIKDLALFSIFGIAIWTVSLVVYRLFFHPLAKYPGPFLAKLSDIDHLYHCWKGDSHIYITHCHEKYGPVFRYQPNSLCFHSAQALQDIYGHKANIQKASFYDIFSKGGSVNTLSAIDKKVHNNKRRLLGHAFSERALRSVEFLMTQTMDNWFSKLEKITTPLNMAEWASYLTSDVMGELAFGKAFHTIDGENRFVGDLLVEATRYSKIVGSKISIKKYGLDKILFPENLKQEMDFVQFGQKMVSERRAIKVPHHDFYHYLLEAKDDNGVGLPDGELFSESNLLIAAGSDTTSTAIAAATFYLGRNPQFLAKVADEVRTIFKDQDAASIRTSPELSSCKYLKAVIDETLRMSPPTPGLLPRQVMPGGAVIDGHQIPAGVDVGLCLYSLHHNADYFVDPWTFMPDRWFASPEDVQKALSAYAPFSVGPRHCIGKNMAKMELTIALARLLKQYDFTVVSDLGNSLEHNGQYDMQDAFVGVKDGPMVQLIPVHSS